MANEVIRSFGQSDYFELQVSAKCPILVSQMTNEDSAIFDFNSLIWGNSLGRREVLNSRQVADHIEKIFTSC